MEVLERFWQELKQVKFFRFVSLPGEGSLSGWQGIGNGEVFYEALGSDSCFIKEEGLFSLEGQKKLTMCNEWLWCRDQESITLSHTRRGRDNPVQLFELIATSAPHKLITSSPHYCGKDIYKASVIIQKDGFDMSWLIKGPKKDENLSYIYRRFSID